MSADTTAAAGRDWESEAVDAMVDRDAMYVQATRLDRVAQRAEALLSMISFDADQLMGDRDLQEAYFGLKEAIAEAYCCSDCKRKIRPAEAALRAVEGDTA